ncbi:GIY-YIG nuclease family protein [Lentisphaera profundi]|uniref:GIY-YIG nuclease family protein n=1 Tax=Lentisphaera profundi TaxID=1658616 RepID=A0ABY7VQC5_9BACT|nr:GIY-YIG nuclease family protein [Lentisphaera profundi]WDE95408.1 GIY-YIG nuclease family protein [Lentisphaera profundi]
MMTLFSVLNLHLHLPDVAPELCKIHLAQSNNDSVLDHFYAGTFQSWQEGQTQKNFGQAYIISLIQLPQKNKWLFAGCFRSLSVSSEKINGYWKYETEELTECSELEGRLIIDFQRTGRASYLRAENWAEQLTVAEFKAQRMSVQEFPGYNQTSISKSTLDIIISQQIQSWRGALSNIAGIYLITDTNTGKLYVGSATGSEGIWQRWSDYSVNVHGGNKDLKEALKLNGSDYSRHFQYSILEIADTHASDQDILTRESYWKQVLRTREFGYNAN